MWRREEGRLFPIYLEYFCTSLGGICAGNSWQWHFEVQLRCDLTLQLMCAVIL